MASATPFDRPHAPALDAEATRSLLLDLYGQSVGHVGVPEDVLSWAVHDDAFQRVAALINGLRLTATEFSSPAHADHIPTSASQKLIQTRQQAEATLRDYATTHLAGGHYGFIADVYAHLASDGLYFCSIIPEQSSDREYPAAFLETVEDRFFDADADRAVANRLVVEGQYGPADDYRPPVVGACRYIGDTLLGTSFDIGHAAAELDAMHEADGRDIDPRTKPSVCRP